MLLALTPGGLFTATHTFVNTVVFRTRVL